jgi:peptidoglycan/LPS O-acetylase OafA/YrhL
VSDAASSAPAPVPAADVTPKTRLIALDGLRGIAALIVVFHHLSLTLRPFSDVWIVPTTRHPPIWSADWWFTSTPAELLIAGPEAVLIFFVLSGLVVALPAMSARPFDWVAYFPQRVARLYLPVVASILLSIVWILATSWSTTPSTSLWVQAYRFRLPTWRQVLGTMDLLFGNPLLNNPLWTLSWELLFSLLLPLFVLIAVATRRWWWAVLVGCAVLVGVGTVAGNGSLSFLPVFLAGTVVAARLPRLVAWAERRGSERWFLWAGAGVLILSLLLLDLHWTLWGALGGAPRFQPEAIAVQFIGAFGIVVLAIIWRPLSRLLSTRLFRWLGRISFSLYLVHVPVIIAMDALFGRSLGVLRIVLSLAVALAIAELFSRFVELPAHRFSRRLGRASSALMTSVVHGDPLR